MHFLFSFIVEEIDILGRSNLCMEITLIVLTVKKQGKDSNMFASYSLAVKLS